MSLDIFASARSHILAVAHRGVSGGNIPCNTLASYDIAVRQGADMIEIDVEMSTDGKLFIFHPGMERHHLGFMGGRLCDMSWSDIRQLRYCNGFDDTPTQFPLNTLDEVFETFKNRCFINVDKFWGHPAEIAAAIKRHDIGDQVVVKSGLSDAVLDTLEAVAPELYFMPIVKHTHPAHEALMKRRVNYMGAEVLFDHDDEEVCSPAFIDRMHRDGKLVWVNAIIYNSKAQLAAGHSDDTSVTVSPDAGWGWLADRGFDLIQTDWTLMMLEYLRASGKYNR